MKDGSLVTVMYVFHVVVLRHGKRHTNFPRKCSKFFLQCTTTYDKIVVDKASRSGGKVNTYLVDSDL